jgi:hypothetical protein
VQNLPNGDVEMEGRGEKGYRTVLALLYRAPFGSGGPIAFTLLPQKMKFGKGFDIRQ